MSTKIISVVGAGGKTTAIKQLSENLGSSGKAVLVCTTAKMKLPERFDYDIIITDRDYGVLDAAIIYKDDIASFINEKFFKGRITYFLSKIDFDKNKFMHCSDKRIRSLKDLFDIILVEADGARGLNLKAPKKKEPVISGLTTHTMAVIDISMVGEEADESTVYNLKGFCKTTGVNRGEKITLQHMYKLIASEKGYFKNAIGKKILLINKVRKNNQAYAQELKELSEAMGLKVYIKKYN